VLVKPCPTELTAPINPDRGVEGHRNLFCNFYDACLDEAVKQGWNSWSCTRCGLHALEPEGEGTLVTIAHRQKLRGYSKTGGFLLKRATGGKLQEALDGLVRALG